MITYYIFRFFETILFALPQKFQEALFIGIAKIIFLIDFKHKNIIKANLDLTIKDEISKEQYNNILRYCHKNLILVLLQVLRSNRMSLEELHDSVSFENKAYVDEAIAQNRKIIFISAHYGNWELGGISLGGLVSPATVIYKKMNNSYFDNYLMRSRTKFNLSMTEKRGAIKQLVKALKKGDSISMLIDQNVNPKDGIIVDFLGQKATQTAAAAFLARKFDALIIPLLINTKPGNDKVITFYEPIITAKTEDEEKDIQESAQAQADVFSKAIKAHPEPWFWCHKRWKSTHKEIYK